MLERELRLLIEENAIKEVVALRQPGGGYLVEINGRTLKSARREVRRFAKLDTVAELLYKLGIERFVVLKSDLKTQSNHSDK
jgi:hypothetical protein